MVVTAMLGKTDGLPLVAEVCRDRPSKVQVCCVLPAKAASGVDRDDHGFLAAEGVEGIGEDIAGQVGVAGDQAIAVVAVDESRLCCRVGCDVAAGGQGFIKGTGLAVVGLIEAARRYFHAIAFDEQAILVVALVFRCGAVIVADGQKFRVVVPGLISGVDAVAAALPGMDPHSDVEVAGRDGLLDAVAVNADEAAIARAASGQKHVGFDGAIHAVHAGQADVAEAVDFHIGEQSIGRARRGSDRSAAGPLALATATTLLRES